VDRLRDHAAAKLGHTPAMWLTEWGWEDGGMIGERKITEDTLAALVPRAYLTAADAGVETLCWFSIRDSVDGAMGLTHNDGQRRKSFDALACLSATLGDCTSLAHVVGGDHPTHGLQAYRLSTPGGDTTLVAWDIDGNVDATLAGPAGPVADVLGRPVTAARGADGRLQLHLGRSPLYVRGVGGAATVEPVAPSHLPPVDLFP